VKIGEALLKLGSVDEATLARFLAKQQGMPFVDLDKGKDRRRGDRARLEGDRASSRKCSR
jgi:hypothetical protein